MDSDNKITSSGFPTDPTLKADVNTTPDTENFDDISEQQLIKDLRASMKHAKEDTTPEKSIEEDDFFFDDDDIDDEEIAKKASSADDLNSEKSATPTAATDITADSSTSADTAADLGGATTSLTSLDQLPSAANAADPFGMTVKFAGTNLQENINPSESADNNDKPENPGFVVGADSDIGAAVDAAIDAMNADSEQKTQAEAAAIPNVTAEPEKAAKPKKEKKAKEKKEDSPGTRKTKKILLGVIAVLLVIAIALYAKTASTYKTHFLPNTTINGFEVSGKTVAEVEQLLSDQAQEYTLTINFRDNVTETIKATDIDYAYVPDGSVQAAMDEQNYIFWPSSAFSSSEKQITAPTNYNSDKLSAILTAYPEMQAANMVAPTDAHVLYENGSFCVAEETYGNTLDVNKVVEAVTNAVQTSAQTLNVEDIDGAYAAPTVFKDNQDLIASADSLNKLCNASITYDLTTGKIVLDGNTLKDWLVVDANGNYSKDEDTWNQHIEDFVQEMNAEVSRHTFNATDFGEVDVRTTSYSCDCSWSIDEEAEIEQLKQELNDGTITEREPVWAQAPFTLENGGYGYDQVEIDISRQHLWVYQDGEVAYECDFVSGANTSEKHTPSGIYKVAWKERNHVLKGEQYSDGSYAYETPCSYWMPFITDIGIGMHDATWQSAFGGTRYLDGYGSHGCINLSMTSVSTIYDIVDAGTPVIVYYSEGCDFE